MGQVFNSLSFGVMKSGLMGIVLGSHVCGFSSV